MNPRMTVFDAKRLIGRRFDDEDVKKDMTHWPFTVIDKDGNPFIQVSFISRTFEIIGARTYINRSPLIRDHRSNTWVRLKFSPPKKSLPWFSPS